MPDLELTHFDVMVIGGGPAGYSAAVRAAQLGARAVLIEKDKLGGACLNYACVPTKFLRYVGEIQRTMGKAARYGLGDALNEIDWPAVQSRRQSLIDAQIEGIRDLLDSYGVHVIHGEAHLQTGRTASVLTDTGETSYQADKIIIATGAKGSRLNIPGIGEALSSRELLQVPSLPRRLAIIGGGPVGVELATIFAHFGTAVSLIEVLPRILPDEDAELTGLLEKELKRASIRLYTARLVCRLEKLGDGYRIELLEDNDSAIEADLVVWCAGQKPCLDGLEAVGLRLKDGALSVDKHLYTGTEGIYGAGDVTGKAMLAYVAVMQGRVAAENALGQNSIMRYHGTPRCVFSLPELASVGITEDIAQAKGKRVMVGRSLFSTNIAATIYGERRGLVKVVAEAESGRLLGVQILGPEAPLLIHEAALAIKMRASVYDIQDTLHIHPSLAEALWEASFDATGKAMSTRKSPGTRAH